MPNLSVDLQTKRDLLEDVPMPRDLHSKIMKRVFVASYGKYLFAATTILFVNFGVLSFELYRRISDINYKEMAETLSQNIAFSPEYLAHATQTLYAALPVQSIFATLVTAALCAYMTSVILKFHKNPQSVSLFRSFVR